MKDNSKAKWGDGLKARKNTSSVDMGGKQIWYVDNPLNIEFTVVGLYAEARAKQIAHLPQMVALLKQVAEQSLYFDNGDEFESTELHYDAQAILRDIGEIEGGE